jgi:hypothetical protein
MAWQGQTDLEQEAAAALGVRWRVETHKGGGGVIRSTLTEYRDKGDGSLVCTMLGALGTPDGSHVDSAEAGSFGARLHEVKARATEQAVRGAHRLGCEAARPLVARRRILLGGRQAAAPAVSAASVL